MRRLTLALALVLAAATAQAAIEDAPVRRGFNVSAGGTLRLDAGRGNIRIVTGGSGVAVEVLKSARTNDREDAAELFRDFEIDFDQSGNDVVIRGRDRNKPNWFQWSDKMRVQWNIRVPANYNAELRTSGGSIDVTDLSGKLDARSSGGDIEAGRITGPVNVHTSGGSISIRSASGDVVAHTSGGSIEIGDARGRVEARSSGGSIELDRVSGDANIRTSGGGIRIDETSGAVDAHTSGGSITARFTQTPRGDSRLVTSGGSVNVALAPGVSATIDAHSSGGGVDSDIPITVMGKQKDDSLNGTINGGGPKLVLRSSGGGVSLTKL